MSQQANLHREKGKPPQPPAKFHPFVAKAKPRQATEEEIRKLLGPDWAQVKT